MSIVGYEFEAFLKVKPLTANKPEDEVYIVTRRRNRVQMLDLLKKLNLRYHKLLSFDSKEEFDSHEALRHKKKAIYYYRMEKFYEDNAREAIDLRSLCPTTEIILVELDRD